MWTIQSCVAYEASTTVYADGVSQGTITSAGGTWQLRQRTTNQDIGKQADHAANANNETVGVPTSWAVHPLVYETRTGVNLR